MKNLLQEWVTELPLMQQAVLCSALRGPDGFRKNDSVKIIIRYIRGVIMNPARPDLVAKGRDDVYMIIKPDSYVQTQKVLDSLLPTPFQMRAMEFLGDLDPYPVHFTLHLAHAAEIIMYKHPEALEPLGANWGWFYHEICAAFHMNPESEAQLDKRLRF